MDSFTGGESGDVSLTYSWIVVPKMIEKKGINVYNNMNNATQTSLACPLFPHSFLPPHLYCSSFSPTTLGFFRAKMFSLLFFVVSNAGGWNGLELPL
mmetsp:Transcript_12804/g.33153  ORF Transcript_12804/g.33153 Transcript_12804/m.33153 type:complete len:97 (-) Transcript_12804:513-803(-)